MTTKVCVTQYFLLNVLSLPFTKYKIPISQLQKDFLWKSYEKTVVSKLAILARKWSKIAARKEVDILIFKIFVDGYRSRSAASSCCV